MSGVVVVTLSDHHFEAKFPIGAIWALFGALMYALYIVLLRRRVDNEQKLNIPMFFGESTEILLSVFLMYLINKDTELCILYPTGFVGLLVLVFLWPVFFVLHYSHVEIFQMPNYRQWMLLILNGLIGTVISELLWLW